MRHTDRSPAPESGPMLPPWAQAGSASPTAPSPRWSRGAKIAVGLPLGLITAAMFAVAIVVLVLLAQLTTWAAPEDQQHGNAVAEQAAEPVPPGPTRTAGPDPMDSCAITVAISSGGQHLDRATIECGTQQPLEVSGDFRHQVANHFDPTELGGLEQIIVVDGEARAWLQTPDEGTCLIAYDHEPVACEPTRHHDPAEDEPDSRTPLTPDMLAERGA